MRIGKLRAAEAAYRRQCASGYSQTYYVPRTYPPRLVTAFWRVLAVVLIVTAMDISGFETVAAQYVERLWRNW